MRRLLSGLLSGLMIVPFAHTKTLATTENWNTHYQNIYSNYKSFGAEKFVSSFEKELNEKLENSDKIFLIQTLSSAFKNEPASVPTLTQSNNVFEVQFSKKKKLKLISQFTSENEEANIWTLNGKKLNVGNFESIEKITEKVWNSVKDEYQLGDFPRSTKTSSYFQMFFNSLLPTAHAEMGTVVTILIAAAVIGTIIYFGNKVTKSVTGAVKNVGEKVGNSASNAINKIGDSTSNSINKVGNSAADGVHKISDSATKTLDKTTEVIDSQKKD